MNVISPRFLLLNLCLALFLSTFSPLAAQSVNARNSLKIARSYANQNDWARAKDYAQRALKEEPFYLDALYMRAFAHRELAEYEKAAKDFNEVIQRDPNHLPTYGALADMYLKQKDYDAADEVFGRLSTAPGGAVWSAYYRGVVAYLKGDLEMAEKRWKESLQENTNFADAHHNLGALYLAQNQFPRALRSFQEAKELKPERDMYSFHFAWALERAGRLEESQSALREIIERSSDRQFLLLSKSLENLNRKNYKGALATLKTLAEEHPQNLDVWVLQGRANSY